MATPENADKEIETFRNNFLGTFAGNYNQNEDFYQQKIYYFSQLSIQNVSIFQNLINSIAKFYPTYDGKWKEPERQCFIIYIDGQSQLILKNFFTTVFDAIGIPISNVIFILEEEGGTINYALDLIFLQSKAKFNLFLTITDSFNNVGQLTTNIRDFKIYTAINYVPKMLGQAIFTNIFNEFVEYDGACIIPNDVYSIHVVEIEGQDRPQQLYFFKPNCVLGK